MCLPLAGIFTLEMSKVWIYLVGLSPIPRNHSFALQTHASWIVTHSQEPKLCITNTREFICTCPVHREI